ncbi:MAG: hypothetical protein H7224_05300 [Polaromonas sp.]|nr:hypothetical protein [Polaromonas sp.]
MKKQSFLSLAAAALAASFLSACGGGDTVAPAAGTPATSPSTSTSQSPTEPAVPVAFTLTGTAATGAAIAGGSITANCTVGTASGSTLADGSFTLVLDKGQVAPCLLRVTKAAAPPAPAIELYGFAAAAGRVNITTLTDTALTRALTASPADIFASFDAARAAAINTALPAAISYVQAQFAAANLGSVPANLMTANFVIGDAYDKILDNIGVAFLGAGKTYADFVAVVKKAGDLITVTTPLPITAADITVSPAVLAQPYTGKLTYLQTAADTAGFTGSHVYGRGLRSNLSTVATPFLTYSSTPITDCKLSVDGGNLVLSAGGQTTSVPLTPVVSQFQQTIANTVGLQSSVYINVNPRNLYGDTRYITLAGPVNAAFQTDLMIVEIANGVVSDVTANNAAAGTQTTCGVRTGGNLNTDRSLDALSLPTALITSLKTAAVAKGALPQEIRTVATVDLIGLAASVNFGRGVYTTTNADATIKDVTRVNDCRVELKDGQLRASSVQAGYDKTVVLNQIVYTANNGFAASKTNKDNLFIRGYNTAGTGPDSKLIVDIVAGNPVVTGVESFIITGGSSFTYLICPRG